MAGSESLRPNMARDMGDVLDLQGDAGWEMAADQYYARQFGDIYFAGRKLSFAFSNPGFIKEDVGFMSLLEQNRKSGAAIIYLDEQDPYGLGLIENNDMHYALLATLDTTRPRKFEDYSQGVLTLPLPIFARILGMRKWQSNGAVQLTCDLQFAAKFLLDAFNGDVFIAARSLWEKGGYGYRHKSSDLPWGYSQRMLQNAPRLTPAVLEALPMLSAMVATSDSAEQQALCVKLMGRHLMLPKYVSFELCLAMLRMRGEPALGDQ